MNIVVSNLLNEKNKNLFYLRSRRKNAQANFDGTQLRDSISMLVQEFKGLYEVLTIQLIDIDFFC